LLKTAEEEELEKKRDDILRSKVVSWCLICSRYITGHDWHCEVSLTMFPFLGEGRNVDADFSKNIQVSRRTGESSYVKVNMHN
jgi:hypothetical protein